MDVNLLKQILSTPSYFGREERIREFLIAYANQHSIDYKIDVKGNLYLIKGELGEGEYYPCVVAHMDTVHEDQKLEIDNKQHLIIDEKLFEGNTKLSATKQSLTGPIKTGIGGDDKAGIFICLEQLSKFDKIIAAFFVEEEFGCLGSASADKKILEDVGYFIQFDAPTDNWCTFTSIGVRLFNEEVFDKICPILKEFNITKLSTDPYTDTYRLKKSFNVITFNFFAGYNYQHTKNEFVIVEHVEKSVNFGESIIKELGLNRYEMLYVKETYKETEIIKDKLINKLCG